MASNLCSVHLPVSLSLGRGSLLLVSPLFHFPQCHNGLVSSRNERVCLCHSITRAGSWYGKSKGSRCLHPQLFENGHWVRVDHYIVMDWAHVLVIVQCQTDGSSLGCKDGAVVWQSFGHLAAGCLTILEMAVDDRRCPHSLVHFEAISVDFIMRYLRFMTLIELSLGFFSGDHTFTYSFNEVVSRARTSNYIPPILWVGFTCPRPSPFMFVMIWHSMGI